MNEETPATGQATQDERMLALVGYIACLFIVPLILKPKSDYCRWHAKQSIVLFLGFLVFLVVLTAIPLIGSLITLVLFALYILAMYKAYNGELWRIPVVADLADKIDIEMLYKKASAPLKVQTTEKQDKKAEDKALMGGDGHGQSAADGSNSGGGGGDDGSAGSDDDGN